MIIHIYNNIYDIYVIIRVYIGIVVGTCQQKWALALELRKDSL